MDKILTKFRQTILLLDPNILLTKLGQNVDIFLSKFCQIYKNLGQSNSFQTNIGQLTKILDKILTKIRQNLVKLRLFWQLLDIDKTWTKIGQNLDKTWTFVKRLSKFCPNLHSIGAPLFPQISRQQLNCSSLCLLAVAPCPLVVSPVLLSLP